MTKLPQKVHYNSDREKFLGLSLESTRKSYYPQLREQLETAKDNEKRLQLLIDNLPARISYIDADDRYVLVNRHYEKVFELSKDEIIGQKVSSIIGEENYRNLKPHREKIINGDIVTFETTFTTPTGRTEWHEYIYVPILKKSGELEGYYVLARDLTEKKIAEEEQKKLTEKLREIQKFQAIGTLAGGIAHDFNNLLMGIQGHASLLGVQMPPGHPLREHVQAIEEHVRSATNLTKQLLGFARAGKYEVKPWDINELVLESAEMFGRTRKQLSIHRKLSQKPLIVEIDHRQIEQVLINIYVNAWQAMPDGGEIYLETTTITIEQENPSHIELTPGNYAVIQITDTGTGMSAELQKRIFDPFFTTKEKHRGTGLGLASAYGIVNNHGGSISVYSEPGHGSTFKIYLPLSTKQPQHELQATPDLVKGSGLILLVDDEDLILDVGKKMLEGLGYSVVLAQSGKQGCDILNQQQQSIDLVILDLVMPGWDGEKTFDEMRKVHPAIPVILSSGYSLEGQANRIMQKGCNGFIQKPFSLAELAELLDHVINPSHDE